MQRDLRTLQHLAAMPFLDRLELAAVSNSADRTMHDVVTNLKDRELVASIRHSTDLIASTRRLYVTKLGLRWLAEQEDEDVLDLLQRYPVSRHWQRILLERLDAVGVIYRLASYVADVGGALSFKWYRSSPLDAGMFLPDGRAIGVVRQGATSDRTGFSKRVWRLLETGMARPDALLVIVPDEMRMRHSRGLFRRARVPVRLALEKRVALGSSSHEVWHLPSFNTVTDLRTFMSNPTSGGSLPVEQRLARPLMPRDIEVPDRGFDCPDHLLPAVLTPALKRTMDILADWSWITHKDLNGLLGVTAQRTSQLTIPLVSAKLARRIHMGGKERLGLTDWGIAVLARRDRTSVGGLRNQWSVEPKDERAPLSWQNVSGRRSRLLARNMEHTDAVHGFLAHLSRQAKASRYRVVMLEPPHRASRFFEHNHKMRSIHPDAFGIISKRNKTLPFFLEWERRAVRPGTMAERLAPYLRYYSTHNPTDDHGAYPAVLIVFDDVLVESRFLGVAGKEMARTRVDLPLWVSHKEALEKEGPLGKAWRSPDVLEATYAFTKVAA